MKKGLLTSFVCVGLAVACTIAFARTPQEEVSYNSEWINKGGSPESLTLNYAERSVAYEQLGQHQNCLNDMAWLKKNKPYYYFQYKNVPESRTAAFTALGKYDEAVQDMFETLLYSGNAKDLRRLKEFVLQHPEYTNYLNLDNRTDLLMKYRNNADKIQNSANYTGKTRTSENGWYMMQIAEKMGFDNIAKRANFYRTWTTMAYDRYDTCKWHPEDPSFNISSSDKAEFNANGGISCSYVMSKEGLEEGLRIATMGGELYKQQTGNTAYDSYWKQQIANWNQALGKSSTTNIRTNSNNNYSQTNNNGFNKINNTLNETSNTLNNVNSVINNFSRIRF